jgi:hypothetical protein
MLFLQHCFIFILVQLICNVSISSFYCNNHSDLCTLCLSCYYIYIVLSLYLYCRYVVYLEHHFTVISRQTLRGHNGPDYMVVGFTTTYANQCQSSLILCIRIRERCTTLCDKFVCDLRQTVVSFWVLRFLPPIKLTATK